MAAKCRPTAGAISVWASATGGVFVSYEIKPWKVVFGNGELLRPAL